MNVFYEQFSDASEYDIDIGWANDATLNDIDFTNLPKIQKLLSNINPNKAYGPDGIHGRILKNCPHSLHSPHSLALCISKPFYH